MKLLLDENLPRRLKIEFKGHEVSSVGEMGWLGKRNGELLRLLSAYGFDGFVTMDKNLQYQQNLSQISVCVIVLNAPNNKIDTLKPYTKKLAEILTLLSESKVIIVDID